MVGISLNNSKPWYKVSRVVSANACTCSFGVLKHFDHVQKNSVPEFVLIFRYIRVNKRLDFIIR